MNLASKPSQLNQLAQTLNAIAPTWCEQDPSALTTNSISSGFQALDACLPGKGWPVGQLIELSNAAAGIGELRLILPALRNMCATHRHVVFIQPPFMPNPAALQQHGLSLAQIIWLATENELDGLWAATQLLRNPLLGAVLIWGTYSQERHLRKLQLAAQAGSALTFLYRPVTTLQHFSPAALRIELQPESTHVNIQIHKVRGNRPASVRLTLPILGL
jgi:protein ImuA